MDAVVHGALSWSGSGLVGAGGILGFVEKNLLGTLSLIESARKAGVGRFIFISSCSVHEKILNDRPLVLNLGGILGGFNWSSQHLDDEVLRCRHGNGESQTGRVGLRYVRLAGRR